MVLLEPKCSFKSECIVPILHNRVFVTFTSHKLDDLLLLWNRQADLEWIIFIKFPFFIKRQKNMNKYKRIGLGIFWFLVFLSQTLVADDEACLCLQKLINEKGSPFVYNERFKEYQIQIRSKNKESNYIVRYCPSCGKKAPEGIRGNMFYEVSTEDAHKIRNLLKNLKHLMK